jgi:hypothetical protein
MPLAKGGKFGVYTIQALVGKGGMGEVYRTHDPRVDRDVAIKVSAAQFSERFEREARAVAALNHPNVCALYDVGNCLVMEYMGIDGRLVAAEVTARGSTLEAGKVSPLFAPSSNTVSPDFNVSADGRSFLFEVSPEPKS